MYVQYLTSPIYKSLPAKIMVDGIFPVNTLQTNMIILRRGYQFVSHTISK